MAEPKEHFNSPLYGWDVAGSFFLVTSSYKLKWEPFSGSGMDGKGLLKAAVFMYWVWSPGVTRKELRPQIIMSHCNKKVLFSLLGFLTSSTLSTMLPCRKACRKASSSAATSAQTSVWASYLRRHRGFPTGLCSSHWSLLLPQLFCCWYPR